MLGREILIIGASVRAAAESARRAGLLPHAIDLFADRDLRAIAASVQRCPMADYPQGLIARASQRPGLPLLLAGAMENHLDAVAAIAPGRQMLGPDVAAMRAARSPDVFEGLRHPVTLDELPRAGDWLIKPRRSAGGRGIRPWTPGTPLPAGHVLQERVAGRSLGAVYRSGDLLGVSEQLIGDPALGARDFLYAGSVGPLPLTAALRDQFATLGLQVAARAGLRGLFGIDCILDRDGQLWALEVNPRYTASVELLERATGLVALNPSRVVGDARPAITLAKGIVYATRDVVAPDLMAADISDVPAVGEAIEAGHPICTLWAQGDDRDQAVMRLHDAARRLYDRLYA
jgi:predicted ATP-grasp superfamily ATP-dependent carboligase